MTINQLRKLEKDELVDMILDLRLRIIRIQEDNVLPEYFIGKIWKNRNKSVGMTIPRHYGEYMSLKAGGVYKIYIKK